jgi:hypothetical protein
MMAYPFDDARIILALQFDHSRVRATSPRTGAIEISTV